MSTTIPPCIWFDLVKIVLSHYRLDPNGLHNLNYEPNSLIDLRFHRQLLFVHITPFMDFSSISREMIKYGPLITKYLFNYKYLHIIVN
jgi:hypothetical protein